MGFLKFVLVAVVITGMATVAGANLITLTDGNSTVTLNPDSQSGVNSWIVDGTSQLYQQWFWYRIGDTAEQSIDTLSSAVVELTGLNEAKVTYTSAITGLKVEVDYTLYGGSAGSGVSDISELIRVTNTGTSTKNLHFYQYSDFDLGGTPGDDSVVLLDSHTWRQTDPLLSLSETVATPAANRSEANLAFNTLNKLNDAVATDLDNSTAKGPGDVTWAWQWDKTIAAGGTLIISKDKQINPIPAPGAVALGVLGLTFVGWVKRRFA